MVELHDAVLELTTWQEGKGLLLHSEGDFFCSGADLNFVKSILNSEDGYQMSQVMHDSMTRLEGLSLVSVAYVHGKALGGGAEFTISPDFRLFSPKGELRFVQAKMGVATGWAGGTMLVKKFGSQLALDLLLTGRKITSEDAVSLGIASDVVDSLDAAEEWLKKRIALPTEVLRTIKAIVHCASVTDCHHALIYERELFSLLWGGTAQKEALAGNLKHT